MEATTHIEIQSNPIMEQIENWFQKIDNKSNDTRQRRCDWYLKLNENKKRMLGNWEENCMTHFIDSCWANGSLNLAQYHCNNNNNNSTGSYSQIGSGSGYFASSSCLLFSLKLLFVLNSLPLCFLFNSCYVVLKFCCRKPTWVTWLDIRRFWTWCDIIFMPTHKQITNDS